MGSLLGQQITPQNPIPWINQAYNAGGTMGALLGAIGNSGMNYNEGGASATFKGLPGYEGQLSPDKTDPLGAAGSWQPWNAGTLNMAQGMAGFNTTPQQYQDAQSNMAQYGGIGGYPTDLMHSMAQNGGTGGAGNLGMAGLMQYGSASPSIHGMNDISQFGATGTWGDSISRLAANPMLSAPGGMLNRYMGGGQGPYNMQPAADQSMTTAPMGTLAPYIGAQAYQGQQGIDGRMAQGQGGLLSPYQGASAYGAQAGADRGLAGSGGLLGQGMQQLRAPGLYNDQNAFGLSTGATPLQGNLNQLAGGDASGIVGGRQLLSGTTSGADNLQSIVAGGGNPINQLPAWQSMIGAQQRNIGEQRAGLQAQFDVGDNRFSSAFGQAATDFETQTSKDQNALLGQMTAAAGENAQQRLLGASGQLASQGYGGAQALAGLSGQAIQQQAGQGYGGTVAGLQAGLQGAGQLSGLSQGALQQLSGQGYGSQMAQFGTGAGMAQLQANLNQQSLAQLSGQGYGSQMAQFGAGASAANQLAGLQEQAYGQLSGQGYGSQMTQYGLGAQTSGQLAGLSAGAGTQLSNLGMAGNQAINQNMLAGTTGLFGGENTAALSMYGGQNSTLPAFMQQSLGQQQLGLQSMNDLSTQWNQGLITGNSLGQQQYVNQQSALNNAYQQWQYTQPQNNPFVSMLYGAGTNFPAPVYPGYQPGALGSLLSGAGSVAGGLLGSGGLSAIFPGLSDARLKLDVAKIGMLGDTPLYSYRFPWSTQREVGVMAQEAFEKHPEAVNPGGDNPWEDPWTVNYSALLGAAARSN